MGLHLELCGLVHTTQWKHLQNTIELGQNLRNIRISKRGEKRRNTDVNTVTASCIVTIAHMLLLLHNLE